ncbi:ComF family protein [soil metagenome]
MSILDLIFPKSCLECGKSGKYICDSCLSKVQTLNRFDPVSKTFSIFQYESVVRKAIIKIKYNFAYDIAEELAEFSIKSFKNPFINTKNIVLIPIPLHKTRQNWRGFNQSEILGELIALKLNWKLEKNILIRKIQGNNQVGLQKSDRVRNIRGKFALNSKAKLDLHNTYIIFDDVATTGSTIKEAIYMFKKEGIKNIYGLTIAR